MNKLENEIIEWDAHKKLCRRDEELEEIDTRVYDLKVDLGDEDKNMAAAMVKKEAEKEKAGDKDGELAYTIESIDAYQKEIKELLDEIEDLGERRDKCFEEFDPEIPYPVRDERNKREKTKGTKSALGPRGAAKAMS